MLDFGKYYFMPMLLEEDFHFGWMTLVKREELSDEEIKRCCSIDDKRYSYVSLDKLKDYLNKHKRTIIYDWEVKLMDKEYQDYVYSLGIKIASETWMYSKEETDKLFGEGYYDKYYGNHKSLPS